MSRFIIERYIYDAFNARATLANDDSESRREMARDIIRDIDLYFADHMEDLFEARTRLAHRTDLEGREMLAYVDETLAAYDDAEKVARAAIERATRA